MTKPRHLLGLTLHRPWSVLMARGIKPIENRKWEPGFRLLPGEWFALHAGKGWDPDCIAFAQERGVPLDLFDQRNTVESAIVAVAQFAGIVHAGDEMTEAERRWFFGPVGWRCPKVVEIAPIRCRGAQGLWAVPPEIADQVRAAFKVATR